MNDSLHSFVRGREHNVNRNLSKTYGKEENVIPRNPQISDKHSRVKEHSEVQLSQREGDQVCTKILDVAHEDHHHGKVNGSKVSRVSLPQTYSSTAQSALNITPRSHNLSSKKKSSASGNLMMETTKPLVQDTESNYLQPDNPVSARMYLLRHPSIATELAYNYDEKKGWSRTNTDDRERTRMLVSSFFRRPTKDKDRKHKFNKKDVTRKLTLQYNNKAPSMNNSEQAIHYTLKHRMIRKDPFLTYGLRLHDEVNLRVDAEKDTDQMESHKKPKPRKTGRRNKKNHNKNVETTCTNNTSKVPSRKSNIQIATLSDPHKKELSQYDTDPQIRQMSNADTVEVTNTSPVLDLPKKNDHESTLSNMSESVRSTSSNLNHEVECSSSNRTSLVSKERFPLDNPINNSVNNSSEIKGTSLDKSKCSKTLQYVANDESLAYPASIEKHSSSSDVNLVENKKHNKKRIRDGNKGSKRKKSKKSDTVDVSQCPRCRHLPRFLRAKGSIKCQQDDDDDWNNHASICTGSNPNLSILVESVLDMTRSIPAITVSTLSSKHFKTLIRELVGNQEDVVSLFTDNVADVWLNNGVMSSPSRIFNVSSEFWTTQYGSNVIDNDAALGALSNLARNGFGFHFVADESFKKYLSLVAPNYKVPTTQDIIGYW